jgi:copper transport protein
MDSWARRTTSAPRLALVGILVVAWCVLAATPVSAHAKVRGTEPADGALVTAAPERVTVLLAAKPATVEGDPLRVYAPNGERVDDGRVVVSDDGRTISVGVHPIAALSPGRFHVAYRVLSADQHLVSGRFAFETAGVAAVEVQPASVAPSHRDAQRDRPVAWWPKAVVAAVALAAVARIRRSTRERRPVAR